MTQEEFKEKSDYLVFPCVKRLQGIDYIHNGITKRELFAAMAMQGIIAAGAQMSTNESLKDHTGNIAKLAVLHADSLIDELKQTNEHNK